MENNDLEIQKKDWRKTYLIPAICLIGYVLTMYQIVKLVVMCVAPLVQKGLGLSSSYLSIYLVDNYQFDHLPLDIQNYLATTSTFVNFLTYLILFCALVSLFLKALKSDFISLGENSHKIGCYIVFSVLMAYGFQLVTNLLVSGFLEESVSQNQASIELIFNSKVSNALIMILTTVFLGPVVEELIFRKCAFSFFKNDVVAIIVSSLFFGLIHTVDSGYSLGQLILHTIPYSAAGLAFGLAYTKSNRNIIVPMAGHMFMNCIATLMSLTIGTVI